MKLVKKRVLNYELNKVERHIHARVCDHIRIVVTCKTWDQVWLHVWNRVKNPVGRNIYEAS